MQVDFYQLAGTPLEQVIASIAERVLAVDGRLLVVADDEVAIEGAAEGSKGKGKGKAVASTAAAKGKGRKSEGAGDCPKGAGLKDGAVLAFRWEGDGAPEESSWGVQLAIYEDAYGVQNEGDVGGRAEFEG